MSKIFEYDNSINFENQIIWQYANAGKMNALLGLKQHWYNNNQEGFWQDWAKDVLSIETATDFGLSVWGNLLQVPRTYEINGEMTTLDTEQYRLLLRGRLVYLRMNGSVPEINQYLQLLFSQKGRVYVRDNLDMTMEYIFEFMPSQEDRVVLLNTNVLPRPAGVGYKIYIIPPTEIFGFNGSGLMGFNQSPFWDRSSIIQGSTELS